MQPDATGKPKTSSGTRLTLALLAAFVLLLVISRFAPRSTAVAPGYRHPLSNFAMPDLDGKTWNLDDHRGKIVIVNFWATWCPPCRHETPDLVAVANRYAGKGVDAVGVSLDKGDPDVIRKFVREQNIPYPVVRPQADTPFVSGITSIPVTLLIDRQGRIARTYNGMVSKDELTADLDRLLAE
jgi:peroxiredoxin